MNKSPPTYKSPPVVVIPPELFNVATPTTDNSLTSIGTLYLHFAPVTCIKSEPSSSYSIFESPLFPKTKNVSSRITTDPVPFGSNIMFPSVSCDEMLLPSNLKLSTFHWSTLRALSNIGTNPLAPVVGFT